MSAGEAAYQSQILASLRVSHPDSDDTSYKEVRTEVIAGGALRVYRSRYFSTSVPFEVVFPHGAWTKYDATPAR